MPEDFVGLSFPRRTANRLRLFWKHHRIEIMLSEAEISVLDRRREGPAGLAAAAVALLVDRDATTALANLRTEAATLRGYFDRARPQDPPDPQRFGFSPCDGALLAACDILGNHPPERRLEPLATLFLPPTAEVEWSGCCERAIDPALALIAWGLNDAVRCGRHLVRSRPDDVLDEMLTKVISLQFRNRGSEVSAELEKFAGPYATAMAAGLWRNDPYAFVHVRLLAALKVGAERGCINISDLPDTLPYVPVWFLRETRRKAP
jgi:hypothetical protein